MSAPWPQPWKALSVIDFGDMHETITVAEPAIAAAYALLQAGKAARCRFGGGFAGYHRCFHCQRKNWRSYSLVAARLAVSVVNLRTVNL